MKKETKKAEEQIVMTDRDYVLEGIAFVYDDLGFFDDTTMDTLESLSDKELFALGSRFISIPNYKAEKVVRKESSSIFVEKVDEILNDESYFNKKDESLLKKITIGYMMLALDRHPAIKNKLTMVDLDAMFFSMACGMDELTVAEALVESEKYDLNI